MPPEAVPAVFHGEELIYVGRGSLAELLDKLEERFGTSDTGITPHVREYDLLVAGGGPAGASAAIYAARKGLRVAVVAEKVGGQVNETVGIENLISVPRTTGAELAGDLRRHMEAYGIDICDNRRIERFDMDGGIRELHAKGGEVFRAPALVVATGASWRRLGVPGEAEYIGRGVAFCPHCDGPFYAGRHVAVIGGGKYYFGTTPSQYTSVRLGEFPNPNVGWEKAKKLNLGADLSFFNQLNISVDYFKENREGIFLQRKSIPMYVGLSTKPWVNIGKMRNSGIDASLEYHQPLGKDLHLTVRGNFTYARNRIMDQDEPDYAYTYMNHSGQMQWQKFGLVAAGLFQDQEDIDSWAKQSFGEVKPGDIKYLDLNGDGIVDNYDTKPIGYSDIPEIVYGFGFSLQWKAFDLSAFFQGVAHVSFSTLTDQTQAFVGRNLKESSVFADLYGNTWTPENPGAKYPRMTTGAIDNNNQLSTFWMANGRYLRLKNLELGYTLPKRIANKIAMQSLRVYLSGVNLFTFSPFKLWDPDLQTGATNYPNNRIINLGLTIGF